MHRTTNNPVTTRAQRRTRNGQTLDDKEITLLFTARGAEFDDVCSAADELRAEVCGDVITYVVNRNINYTNICYFRCGFCGFSKGKHADHLRGKSITSVSPRSPYELKKPTPGALPKYACRAEFTPPTQVKPTSTFAVQSEKPCHLFTFMLFRRSKFGKALNRWVSEYPISSNICSVLD